VEVVDQYELAAWFGDLRKEDRSIERRDADAEVRDAGECGAQKDSC
jgi:hypothetical protein